MSPKRKRLSGNLTILAMELKSNRLEAILEWMKEASFAFNFTACISFPVILGLYNMYIDLEPTHEEMVKYFLMSFGASPIIIGLYWLVYGIVKWRFNRIKAWLLIEEEFDPKAYTGNWMSIGGYRIPTSGGQE